jgi:hypothetical protein
VVEYYDGDASDGSPYTVAATVVPGQTTNQLDAVPLTTPIGGGSRTLGTYISSWSSVTVGRVVDAKQAATASQPATAEVTVPGVVTISSQPVRTGPDPLDPADPSSPLVDPASSVSLTLGALACRVEDDRR